MGTIITIPEPCHEDWGKMTATEKGKFCASCKKEVIDFTNKSQFQLSKLIHEGDNLCGRFRPDQLNREIKSYSFLQKRSMGLQFGIGSLLALCTPAMHGQEKPTRASEELSIEVTGEVKANVENHPMVLGGIAKGVTIEAEKDILFKGSVYDEDGLPLPGVTIQMENADLITYTDFDGNFELKIPSRFSSQYLLFTYIGQKDYRYPIREYMGKPLVINMKNDETQLEQVVVVGYAVQHKTNIFTRIKNLFRKRYDFSEEESEITELPNGTESEPIPLEIEKPLGLKLWPNPTDGQVEIQLPIAISGIVEARLISINLLGTEKAIPLGKVNLTQPQNLLNYDLIGVPKGVYTLVIQQGEQQWTEKIIVEEP